MQLLGRAQRGAACCAQGLGELYEEDYQKAAGFAAEDTDEPLRQEVQAPNSELLLDASVSLYRP